MTTNLARFILIGSVVAFSGLFLALVERVAYDLCKATWKFIDRHDFRTGLTYGLLLAVVDGTLWANRLFIPAVVGFAVFPFLATLYFETGTLGGEYGFLKKRGLVTETWKGPGHYLIARHNKVDKLGAAGHSIAFSGEKGSPIEALSRDGVTVKVSLAASFWLLPDGIEAGSEKAAADKADAALLTARRALLIAPQAEEADATVKVKEAEEKLTLALNLADTVAESPEVSATDDAKYRLSLQRMGSSDKMKDRARPILEQAVRDAVGSMRAIEAATTEREELRALIVLKAAPLLKSAQIDLKGIVLGEVEPESLVRLHEISMRHWEGLEQSIGPKGLAKHRIDSLEKAGVVVVPSDPSLHLAAASTRVPPPPPASGK